MGPANADDKCVRILDRIITWTEEGIRYEADQRHAKIIIRQLGLKDNSNGVSAPGIKADEAGGEEKIGNQEALNKGDWSPELVTCVKTGQIFNLP